MSPAASTRWCPTPEQVMILEEMYRGGVRTPNASHIQQITAHLSLYGKIEGKNVFYWFQNHKARDRQKLRKRLLGKQQQQHHHQQQLLHHHHHHFDHHPILFPIPSVDHHPCQQPHPPPPPFPHRRHHQHQLPCCPSSSINVGFHHPPHMFNPPYFSPPHIHHQSRSDESCLAMRTTNIYNWKGDSLRTQSFGIENQKLVRFSNDNNNDNDNDWMMMNDYDNHDSNSYDDHFTTTTTSLKTLQLFPVKDNIPQTQG